MWFQMGGIGLMFGQLGLFFQQVCRQVNGDSARADHAEGGATFGVLGPASGRPRLDHGRAGTALPYYRHFPVRKLLFYNGD
jgi:hypothetical protein